MTDDTFVIRIFGADSQKHPIETPLVTVQVEHGNHPNILLVLRHEAQKVDTETIGERIGSLVSRNDMVETTARLGVFWAHH